MKRMLLVTLATSALTALVVGNAYSQKRQFYTTVVYLLNSNRTLGVLYMQAAVMVWVTTTLVKNLFFGTLRAAEVEHLVEKSWYMILETFILLAGFHEDMQVGFVATITFLFVVKGFHWLIEERINYMERSPLITWTFHLRAVSILLLLAATDVLYIRYSWNCLRTKGASVQIVFGLEYTIMLLVAANTFLHYVLHSIDLRSEDPWENKTIYMRYVDIGVGFAKLCLYMSYMLFMMWIFFIPLHIARRVYITAKVTVPPGFPGHPHPPGTAAPNSQPPPASHSQKSPPPPPPPAPSSVSSSPPRSLVEGERQYSFTAGQLDPQRSREEEEGEQQERGGLFTVGETNSSSAGGEEEREDSGGPGEGSPTGMDELRQRRLQRFHSVPAVSQVTATGDHSASGAAPKNNAEESNKSSAQSSEKEQ